MKNKNSLIYKWENDKNPVGVSGDTSKNKIEIKYVDDIKQALNPNKSQSNKQKIKK